MQRVTCAPITRTIRGIASEVELGSRDGLAERSVISCDNVLTIARSLLDPVPVGKVSASKRIELDSALRYALDIRF